MALAVSAQFLARASTSGANPHSSSAAARPYEVFRPARLGSQLRRGYSGSQLCRSKPHQWPQRLKGQQCLRALAAERQPVRSESDPWTQQPSEQGSGASSSNGSGAASGSVDGNAFTAATQPASGAVAAADGEGDDEVDWDAKVAALQLQFPRRSMQVTFTCDRCGGRTSRMVNPLAWNKGLVFCQCASCQVWHKLRDEAGLIEEIRFDQDAAAAAPEE